MGFSFVSLAEIVYHCFLCIVLLFRKKRTLYKKKQAQKTRRKNATILENSYQLDNPGKLYFLRKRSSLFQNLHDFEIEIPFYTKKGTISPNHNPLISLKISQRMRCGAASLPHCLKNS